MSKIVSLTVGSSSERQVKNTRSNAQTLQRILMKVVSMAYVMLKVICGHSFEGVSSGFKSMNKFKKVNLRYLRERAATLQKTGQSLNQFYQFMPIQSEKWSPFAAVISMGHLPEVSVGIDAEGGHKAYVNAPSRSYADFVSAWGLQRGDQVTFVTVQKRAGKYEAETARIVLNPRNASSHARTGRTTSTSRLSSLTPTTTTSCWAVAATWWLQVSSSAARTRAVTGSAATVS